MQEIQATSGAWQVEQQATGRRRISGRWAFLLGAVIFLLLLVLLPPLVSINRYQRRIATSISMSLGRPVHFDHVALNLLPLPGFIINNFVVEEDAGFGSEPIIRANTVVATLRVSSLWRRRIEFSRISFTEPSINLVHAPDGRWNLSEVLSRASRIEAAPTGQARPGSSPRFPYIEATGARINLKQGAEKTPFSLNEADVALWLPNPQEFRLRLQGHPLRTDTSVSNTGSFQLEATVGRAPEIAQVPISVQGTWRRAPLGQVSRFLVARDAGLRGELNLSATVTGTLGNSTVQSRLRITGLRRSEFVPAHELSIDTECTATASRVFHSVEDLRCGWAVPDSGGARVGLTGAVPDVRQPELADFEIGTSGLPASVLLDWLRVVSARTSPTLSGDGLLSGSFSVSAASAGAWTGAMTISQLALKDAKLGPDPVTIADASLHAEDMPSPPSKSPRDPRLAPRFSLGPTLLSLGGRDPAVLEGSLNRDGYTLHLSGQASPSQLAALADAVPALGDGLTAILPEERTDAPVHVDLSAHRAWDGQQVWTDNLARPSTTRAHR